jgi:hypothetical protein
MRRDLTQCMALLLCLRLRDGCPPLNLLRRLLMRPLATHVPSRRAVVSRRRRPRDDVVDLPLLQQETRRSGIPREGSCPMVCLMTPLTGEPYHRARLRQNDVALHRE